MNASRTRYLVLGGLCAAASLAYFVRNGVGPAESTIRADLGLTKEESGLLISAFFWPYALCQIPAAMLAQRIGSRRALALFALLWSLATAGLAVGSFGLMTASRAFMGVAQAGLVPVGVTAMSRWFPKSSQASASGGFSGFMSAGSIVAAPLTAWLVLSLGWRAMFLLYALPGVLWAAWFALWYRDRPSLHPSVNQAERSLIEEGQPPVEAPAKAAVPWGTLIASPTLGFLCLQQFCRAAGYIFFASWFATYLQEARGVTILNSGWLTTLPLLADVTGCLSGGVLSDTILRRSGNRRLARQGLAAGALLLCAGLIAAAWLITDPVLAVLAISAGMFCAATANPVLAATVMTLGGPHVGTVSAMANMSGNLGAAAFPVVVPWLLANAGGWNAVLAGFASLYLFAAVFWLLIRTTGGLFDATA
jgi:ACS family glucarate transporter-like MFS transporter